MAASTEDAQTGEKRRHSTRIRRESIVKREAVELETPLRSKSKETPKAKQTPKPRGSIRGKKDDKPKPAKLRKSIPDEPLKLDSPTPKPEILPAKVRDGEPLPTTSQVQRDLGDDYQSIKDSGVLAVALARSRKRWTTEGIFDKYWTKPAPRKRGDPTPKEKGKPGERIGSCTLTVEPHIFDVSLYIIKETLPPSHPQYHQYAPPPQQHQQPQYQQPTYRPQNQPHPPAHAVPQQHPPPPPVAKTPSSTPAATPAQQQPQQSQPDPVIHMLAQRASTDAELKSIMKIVATGSANSRQLEYFQRHIDELTKLAKKQQEPKKPPAAPVQNQQQHTSFQHQPYHHPPPRPVQAAPPPAIRITALLIEFALDTTSRFLFPAHSILEYGPGYKSCTASFLARRKVSDAEDQAHYRACAAALQRANGSATGQDDDDAAADDTTFWQPVTVRFACETGNMLEILARVVKPPGEVRAWMERVLEGDEKAASEAQQQSLPRSTGVGKPTGPLQPVPPTAAATTGEVKQEAGQKENGSGTAADAKVEAEAAPKYPPGSLRADSRKLAVRLPKEDRGKENEA